MPGRGERHTARHTTVVVTITADDGVEFGNRPVPRGGRVCAPQRVASRWINAGRAVQVNTAKLGARQRSLLLQLAQLERPPLREVTDSMRDAEGNLLPRRRLRARQSPVRWRVKRLQRFEADSPTPSAYAQALRALERRGLIMRDAPEGSGRHTRRVQLTEAGWRLARELLGADAERTLTS